MNARMSPVVSICALAISVLCAVFSGAPRAEGAEALVHAIASAAADASMPGATQANGSGPLLNAPASASLPQGDAEDVAHGAAASVHAKGLNQISLGAWSVTWANGVSNLTVDRITNASTTRTTGTLQLRLLASSQAPTFGQNFLAYTLSQYANFNPLQPTYYYYNITRSASFSPPPDGTYYLSLALYEYDSVNCSAVDRYCIVDLNVGVSTTTFGAARVTVVVGDNAGNSLCIEQYTAAAAQSLLAAGYQVTQYPSTTSCATVGFPYRAGPLAYQGQVLDPTVVVWLRSSADLAAACASGYVLCTTTPPPPGVGNLVVEYYWAARDHYFISGDPAEIAALDATVGGWVRTGQTFKSATAQSAGASPVCRFYIPPIYGDSHYFSASPSECSAVRAKFPMFTYEAPNVFYVSLPNVSTGACPAGTVPVYRLWNNRPDTNHRYTTSLTIRSQMLAKGYVAEGYGPNLVSMCAPQ